jgi:hypothetical protein
MPTLWVLKVTTPLLPCSKLALRVMESPTPTSVFLTDPTNAEAYVSYMDTGVYSLLGFYSKFIEPDATSGVAAQEAYIAPLLSWYLPLAPTTTPKNQPLLLTR